MSHADGHVTFTDGLVLHYEYNGTSDVCIPALHHSYEEMHEHWRNQPNRSCSCNKDENVIIHTSYGRGFEWKGKACRHCMCITKNLIPTMYQASREEWNFWGYGEGE